MLKVRGKLIFFTYRYIREATQIILSILYFEFIFYLYLYGCILKVVSQSSVIIGECNASNGSPFSVID